MQRRACGAAKLLSMGLSARRLLEVGDGALELSVVGSYTALGHTVRSRLGRWSDPPSMTGRRAVITGGTSGIGRAIAAAMLDLGADVVLTSRTRSRAEEAAAQLHPERARGLVLDAGEPGSVDALADTLAEGIDVVVHNGGALLEDYSTNSVGMETTLASHVVGPYRLTHALRPKLNPGAQVIWMSSGGMYSQRLDVDSLEMGEDNYTGTTAYAKAKRAQVELVRELAPQWDPEVGMHSAHPGWVDTPGVDASLPLFSQVMGPLLRSAAQGADTVVWLAATQGGDGPVGGFWHDRRARSTTLVPGTKTSDAERRRLCAWLDEVALG